MAFGFPPKYSEEISTGSYSQEQFLGLVAEACRKMDLDLCLLAPDKLSAFTRISWKASLVEITITIRDTRAVIQSESIGGPLIDFGKNKRNVALLIAHLTELENLSPEELSASYALLEKADDFDAAAGGKVPGASKGKLAGLLSIFLPSQGYFITPILININILVFLAMCLSGISLMQPGPEDLLKWGANFRPVTLDGQWWRLITCCFIHIGCIHLLFNMYALMYIGMLLEPFLGRAKFLMAYLLTGISASLMSLYWHDFTVSAGASGAIFGMYGVFLALLTTNFIDKAARTSLLSSILVFVGYNLLTGIKGEVDNAAHIGGLLSGLLIGYSYYPLLKDPAALQTRNAVMSAIFLITMLLAALVYTGSSNDVLTFTKNMEEFAVKEKTALEIYNLPEQAEKKIIRKKLKQGIHLWRENIAIVRRSMSLKLPVMYQDRIKLLQNYCYSRINTFRFLLRRVEENTERYDPAIEQLNKKTELIINQLKSL